MNIKIALAFIDSINKADSDRMYNLLAYNHQFIDSQGNKINNRDHVKEAWIEYFEFFPDYKIEICETLEKDSLICIFGFASGTYKNNSSNYWRIPAAWKVITEGSRISHWQVYADNSIVLDIMKKSQG